MALTTTLGNSTNPDIQTYYNLLKSLGKATLSAIYPSDFEFYLCALELVDSNDKLIDYFLFPIMPDSINESTTPIMNIRKTLGGITVLGNSSFNPRDISISGNFGRRIKFLLGRNYIDMIAANFSEDGQTKRFSNLLKTGYGCIKLLENILKTANKLDDNGNPFSLHFYNLALGNSYIVRPMNYSFRQSLDTNAIWNYSIQFKALAPLGAITSKSKLSPTEMISMSALNRGIEATASTIYNEIISIA